MLGYDVVEENRSFEAEGLTGNVSRYTQSSLNYPCYIVQSPFELYKVNVLRSMYTTGSSESSDEDDLGISIYFEQNQKMAGFGKIYPRQVNAFLKLFERNNILGFYNEETPLKGDYLYVLGG